MSRKLIYAMAVAALGVSMAQAAPPAKSKPAAKPTTVDVSTYLDQARSAIGRLDFDAAETAADSYRSKGGKAAVADRLDKQIELGRTMLDRVEQIQVIDSIVVDAADFFKAYRLSGPTGRLVDAEVVAEALPASVRDSVLVSSPAFVNEEGSSILWTTDSDSPAEATVMWQSDLLADGSWDTPRQLFSYKSIFDSEDEGESVYTPFLMSDGMTLYFAAEGDASLGGLDLFISRRDEDGFLQPQNIGMPYNSPYDDYMLAIDDVTGVGWWATDRNRIPGKVTIYRFIPSELRVNYAPDTDGLKGLALLKSVSATHPEGADYSAYLDAIESLGTAGDDDDQEFAFALPGGKVYHSLDDFKSDAARRLMMEYLDRREQHDADVQQLMSLRETYRGGDHSVAAAIGKLESKIEDDRGRLRSAANEVIRAEVK